MNSLTSIKKVALSFFGISFFFSFHSMSQTELVVNYYSGTPHSYTITDEGKLYFDNDNLVIVPGDTATVSIPLSIIRTITFPLNQSLGIENLQTGNSDLFIFPNPTREHFRVSSSSTDQLAVKVYTTSGNLVLSGNYYPNDLISAIWNPESTW